MPVYVLVAMSVFFFRSRGWKGEEEGAGDVSAPWGFARFLPGDDGTASPGSPFLHRECVQDLGGGSAEPRCAVRCGERKAQKFQLLPACPHRPAQPQAPLPDLQLRAGPRAGQRIPATHTSVPPLFPQLCGSSSCRKLCVRSSSQCPLTDEVEGRSTRCLKK